MNRFVNLPISSTIYPSTYALHPVIPQITRPFCLTATAGTKLVRAFFPKYRHYLPLKTRVYSNNCFRPLIQCSRVQRLLSAQNSSLRFLIEFRHCFSSNALIVLPSSKYGFSTWCATNYTNYLNQSQLFHKSLISFVHNTHYVVLKRF